MTDFIILILAILILLHIAYKHYKPKIEVVVLVKHYRVYLWYNKWYDNGNSFRYARTCKFLFEV